MRLPSNKQIIWGTIIIIGALILIKGRHRLMSTVYSLNNTLYINFLQPEFGRKVEDLIAFANKKGYDVKITNGHRDYNDTLRIYGGVFKWSHHQFGLAVDVNLKNIETGKMYLKATSIKEWLETGIPQYAKKIGLKWGGDEGFADYDDPIHFDYQLKYPIAELKKIATAKYGSDVKKIADNGYNIV